MRQGRAGSPLDARLYSSLRAQARRLTLNSAEAEDLVQDTLLAALQAGRCDAPWLAGTMRRQAAMAVRAQVRRRQREHMASALPHEGSEDPAQAQALDLAPVLRRMPRSARQVMALALHGLAPGEIRWILQIAPAAFRQRLVSIRRVLDTLPPALRPTAGERVHLGSQRTDETLALGSMRRALGNAMARGPALGSHDPDGHLLLIDAQAHVSAPGGNNGR